LFLQKIKIIFNPGELIDCEGDYFFEEKKNAKKKFPVKRG